MLESREVGIISELPCAFMQNLSYENEFDLHENEHVWDM